MALGDEVAISTVSGDIVWVCGPYPSGSYPDFVIFCDDLKERLRKGEKVITGNGYNDAKAIKLSDAPGKEEYHRSVRGHREADNGRLKRFKVLTPPFRQGKDRNGLCFLQLLILCKSR